MDVNILYYVPGTRTTVSYFGEHQAFGHGQVIKLPMRDPVLFGELRGT